MAGVLNAGTWQVALSRFPFKQSFDALALGKLLARPDLNIGQKVDCLKFYFTAHGIERLYATLPRSGFHYVTLVIEIALDLAKGGDGDYSFTKEFWWPKSGVRYYKMDWRAPSSAPEKLDWEPVDLLFYHTHLPYYRVRSAPIGRMQTIVQVRNIVDVLESWFHRVVVGDNDPGTFPWRRHLNDSIAFLNSWGDYARRGNRLHVVKYEDVMRDPEQSIEACMDFWNLSVPGECLDNALAMTTKEEMNKRLPDAQKRNRIVSFDRPSNVFPDHVVNEIRRTIKDDLWYDFGYVYE